MPNEVSTGIIILALLATAGLIGYQVYKKFKAAGLNGKDALEMITFILQNVDYFVDSLRAAADDIGGINAGDYETVESYRMALISKAITIIESKAALAGITFKLSHETLVNLANIVIEQVIKAIEKQKEQQKLIDDAVATTIPISSDKVDITDALNTSEY